MKRIVVGNPHKEHLTRGMLLELEDEGFSFIREGEGDEQIIVAVSDGSGKNAEEV